MRLHAILAGILWCAVLAGCGGSPPEPAVDAGADLATPPDLAQPPDLTVAAPELPEVDPHSDLVLSSVKLVTITFAGYQAEAQVQQFGDFVVGSDWYKAVGADYGVGPGTSAAKVVLNQDPGPGVTDADVVKLLKGKIMDGTLPAPSKQDSQYLYMIYFPSTTTVNEPGGDALCDLFWGYHSSAPFAVGARMIYAVIGDCSGNVDDVTSTASHELIEAATDPYPDLTGSFYVEASPPDPWTVEYGQEVADLCETEDYVYEGGFALQPIWSNAAAAKRENPCIPSDSPDYMTVTASPSEMPTVAPGQTVTFTLTGWSNKLVPPWQVKLGDGDWSDYSATELQAYLSGTTVGRGGTLTLSMTAPAGAASGQIGGVKILSGPTGHLYPVGFTVE